MQLPNIKQNPSSLNRESQTPDEAGFGAEEKRPREAWSLYLVIFGVIGLLAGLGVAAIYYSQCQTVYLSNATVVIHRPRNWGEFLFEYVMDGRDGYPMDGYPMDVVFHHDQLMAEDVILLKFLNKPVFQDLPSLRGLSKIEQLQEIQNNLTVTAYGDDPMICELQYVSPNPHDAQVVLAAIVPTYEQLLAEKYPERSGETETIELLIRMRDKFRMEVESIDERLKTARERVEALGGSESSEADSAEEEVHELLLAREDYLQKAVAAEEPIGGEESSFNFGRRSGFIFETTQPACPGFEVRPMLSVILPVAGLVGASLGLVMGCLVVLVFRGS